MVLKKITKTHKPPKNKASGPKGYSLLLLLFPENNCYMHEKVGTVQCSLYFPHSIIPRSAIFMFPCTFLIQCCCDSPIQCCPFQCSHYFLHPTLLMLTSKTEVLRLTKNNVVWGEWGLRWVRSIVCTLLNLGDFLGFFSERMQ